MDQRIKELWITALRSGEFPQGGEQLECDGNYCCLGVLEWLAYREGVIPVFDGTRPYLSPAVKDWAGLSDTNPDLGEGAAMSAGWLNDHGSDFSDIADRIEKYL